MSTTLPGLEHRYPLHTGNYVDGRYFPVVTKSTSTNLPGMECEYYPNNTVGYAQKSLVKALEEREISQEDPDIIESYLQERKHNHNLQVLALA